jgi:hypothetical protein
MLKRPCETCANDHLSRCLVKQELIEALRHYFSHLLQAGPFEFTAVDWDAVLKDAHQISAGFAARLKARSADVLHVAILEQVNPVEAGDRSRIPVCQLPLKHG